MLLTSNTCGTVDIFAVLSVSVNCQVPAYSEFRVFIIPKP